MDQPIFEHYPKLMPKKSSTVLYQELCTKSYVSVAWRCNRSRVVFKSFFTITFLQQDNLLVFSSFPCFCTFTGPSLLVLNFYRKFFTPSTTFSFWVVHLITHKMAYRKATLAHVWGHNSSVDLTKERKISDSGAFVWRADRSYTPYTFWVMHEGKEEGRKKKNKIEIFAFNFLDYVKK